MDVVTGVPPAKKNPSGKFIDTAQRKIIIEVYKDKVKQQRENPEMCRLSFRQMIVEISKTTGVGQRTIQTTLSEYRNKGSVSSPNKKKVRPTVLQKVDEFEKNAIRQKIHDFWRAREIPTVAKMLTAINEDETLPNLKRTSFQKVLKDLQFECVKSNGNSGALLEKEDLITWRRSYLDKIRHYRAQNRPIYYLDETKVNVGETHNETCVDTEDLTKEQKEPSGRGKRFSALHIGSTDGFVPGGLLCWESKTDSSVSHYLDEMHSDTFYEWFVKTLPLLKENAVIVMDNAPHHSVKKHQIPVMSWRKQAIIDWLESKGEIVIHPIVKIDLMKKVRKIKKQYDKYVIDEHARDNNKTVLRIPPYHCELNPIKLAWSSVKNYVRTHNNTSKLKDVVALLQKGVKHVTPEMWTNFVEHVIKEEEKFWNIEHITDEIMDEQPEEGARHVLMIGTDDQSFSDLDSD